MGWRQAGFEPAVSDDDCSDNLQSIGSRKFKDSNKLQTKADACAPTVALNHSATASTKIKPEYQEVVQLKNLVERAGVEPATWRLEVDNPRASAQDFATRTRDAEGKPASRNFFLELGILLYH
jgi:hypothetical protein